MHLKNISFILVYSILYFIILDAFISNLYKLGAYQIRIVEGFWENKTLEITLFILVYSILYFIILDAVISNLDANQEPIRSIQQKAFEGMIHLKYILCILGYSILYSQQLVVWYTVYYTQVQIRYVLNESCPQKPSTIWIQQDPNSHINCL